MLCVIIMYPFSSEYVKPLQWCFYRINNTINNQPFPRPGYGVVHLVWIMFGQNPWFWLSSCLDAYFIRILNVSYIILVFIVEGL
jgi:hypothetical protein